MAQHTFRLISLFAGILLLVPPAFADYSVSYEGRSYDSVNNTTTFSYLVEGDGPFPGDDNYQSLRLKAFKLEICSNLDVVGWTPELGDVTLPFFFEGPNPEFVAGADDPVGFNFYGLLWKGWNGAAGFAPVLLNPDESRSFSITYAGNIAEAQILSVSGTGTIGIDQGSPDFGEFIPELHPVTGASCATPTPTPSPSPTPQPSPSPSPTPTPECEDVDITQQQFALDSNARQLDQIVKRLSNRLRNKAVRPGQKKFAQNAKQLSEILALDAWEITWSVQSVAVTCTVVNDSCVSSNNYAVTTQKYLTISQDLADLVDKLIKRIRRLNGGSLKVGEAKLQQQAQNLNLDNMKIADTIPGETYNCDQLPLDV